MQFFQKWFFKLNFDKKLTTVTKVKGYMFWNSVLCIEVNINEVVKIFQGSVPFYPGQLSRAILCE